MEEPLDDGFWREVLEFLDGTPDVLPTLDTSSLDAVILPPPPPPPPPPLPKPTGGAARLKRNLDAARAEATALSDQLARLRVGNTRELMAAKERALAERTKRQRAEADCCALREAVYAQRKCIGELLNVFSGTPRLALGLDLCRYLHRHTRLVRNRSVRWGQFDAEAHNARMRLAMDVLCHETENLSLSGGDGIMRRPEPTPLINGETTDSGDCYTTNTIAVYTVNSTDLSAVVRATCVAVRDVATYCGGGHPLTVSSDIVDLDAAPTSNMLYRVIGVRHPCACHGEELSMETHALTSYKVMNDHAIVLWDFVDVDELHPTADSTNISREVTGACLIRREWCDDGVERTVVRSLTTRKFRFLNQESANKLRRFSCIMHPAKLVQGNEMLFRRIVLDQLATENAIYAQSQPILMR